MAAAGKHVDEARKDPLLAVKKALVRFRLLVAAALFLLALALAWDAWHQGESARASQNVASEAYRIKS
jgi:hypothetical protein